MQGLNENIEGYNPDRKHKVLIVFDYLLVDMINDEKTNQIVTKLFIRGRKSNISHFFITQPCFAVPKDVRLNSGSN